MDELLYWECLNTIRTMDALQQEWSFALTVHWCRFENPPTCFYSYKNNSLKIVHS